MSKFLFALAISITLSGCMKQQCELCGRWRSDAERTLAEMELSPLLTEKQRKFFRTDFYGKLVVETREKQSRAYFPDQSPDSVAWEPWRVVSRSGDVFTVTYSIDSTTMSRQIELVGDCYKVSQPNLGFGEWFCRQP